MKGIGIIICGIFLFLISCNVYREVEVIKTKGTDFSQYKTYAWLLDDRDPPETDFNNDFIRSKNKNYFGHCMNERNLELDTMNPQLLLRVTWLSHSREATLADKPDLPDYYDPRYYDAPAIYLYGNQPVDGSQWGDKYNNKKINYAHGGAKLTVIDRMTNQTVWEGVAQGDLYDPDIMTRDLHPAVHKMMKRFPLKINKK